MNITKSNVIVTVTIAQAMQKPFYKMYPADVAELVSLVGDVICACEVK